MVAPAGGSSPHSAATSRSAGTTSPRGDQQGGQDRPRLRAADGDGPGSVLDLQRPQDPEEHLSSLSVLTTVGNGLGRH